MERQIGVHIGEERGPLLLLFGAMHGNEPAGVEAIKMVFRELALEPFHNPSFKVKGSVLGLVGNLKAYTQGVRYINKDLNRCWKEELIHSNVDSSNPIYDEILEMKEILGIVKSHVKDVRPTEIIMLDIHTTSSKGGIFTITSDDEKSLDLAVSLHAPVVTGILKGLEGTTIHFFRGENMGIPTTALSFEAGHHEDILSPGRAYAAIVNCLRHIGSVDGNHVENRHDKVLIEFSKDLPKVSALIYKYAIPEGSNFVMKEGFLSFDKVQKNEILAYQDGFPVVSQEDGRILMPLYQKQGEEGFFIVKSSD